MAESILIIKHGALGDFIIESGMLRAICARHPGARVTLVTHEMLIPLARQTGWFDDYVVDNRGRYTWRELKRLCKDLFADRPFDRIYDLQATDRTIRIYYAVARFLTRHPMSWGRQIGIGHFVFYTTPAKRAWSWNRATVTTLDIAPQPPTLDFCHGQHEHFHLLPPRYAVLIPGCSAKNLQKRWPAERYRRVSEWLGERGVRSVVVGTAAERAEIETVAKDNRYAVDFMGRSSILDLPDLARGAVLVIGNDTGPSHMSRIAGAKTIMLFTAYDAARAAATMPNVVNLSAEKIVDITLESVLAAAERMLAS